MFSLERTTCRRLWNSPLKVSTGEEQGESNSIVKWEHYDAATDLLPQAISMYGSYRTITDIQCAYVKLTNFKIVPSRKKVRQLLLHHKYHYAPKVHTLCLSVSKMEARVRFAQEMLQEQDNRDQNFFSRLIFSDEVMIQAGDSSRKTWQHPDSPVSKSRTDHPPQIMLWGAMDVDGNFLHHWCEFKSFYDEYTRNGGQEEIPPNKGLGTLYYRSCILQKTYLPWEKIGNKIFMDDNAPGHKAILTIAWWKSHPRVEALRLCKEVKSAQTLPDLNPIENLWSILKLYKNKHRPNTVSEIREVCDRYLKSPACRKECYKLHRTFKKRMEMVILYGGKKIPY